MAIKKPKIAYLGPSASFSGQAAKEFYPENAFELIPYKTFTDIFAAFKNENDQRVHQAIIPIENSTNGFVTPILDILVDKNGELGALDIVGETRIQVELSLLGYECLLGPTEQKTERPDLSQIQRVYSHPQAFTQCSRFIAHHLDGAQLIDSTSTAVAAQLAAQDQTGRSVAIASKLSLEGLSKEERSNLGLLYEGIEDRKDNFTRFLAIGRRPGNGLESAVGFGNRVSHIGGIERSRWRFLMLFSTSQIPGDQNGLLDALLYFQVHGIRIVNVASRPNQDQPWNYVYFVEGDVEEASKEKITRLWTDLQFHTEGPRYWGMWQQSK